LLLVAVVVGAWGLGGYSTGGDRFVVGLVNTTEALVPTVDAFRIEVAVQLSDVGLEVTFVEIGPGVPDLDAAIEDLLTDTPDVVVTWTTPVSVTVAGHLDSTGVPMVFGNVNDPVGAGLVTALENPGVNRTGVGGIFHHRRTIDLFRRVAGVERIALIYEPSGAASPSILALDRAIGAELNAEIIELAVETDDELVALLAGPKPSGIDGIVLFGSRFTSRNQDSVVVAATRWGLPVAIGAGAAIQEGALVFVSVLAAEAVLDMAFKTVAISQGADPADMPVEGAPLVTYLRMDVVDQLGISVPDEALLLFDHVVSTAGRP
jgi:putative ABC transport system substrate-binding protein